MSEPRSDDIHEVADELRDAADRLDEHAGGRSESPDEPPTRTDEDSAPTVNDRGGETP